MCLLCSVAILKIGFVWDGQVEKDGGVEEERVTKRRLYQHETNNRPASTTSSVKLQRGRTILFVRCLLSAACGGGVCVVRAHTHTHAGWKKKEAAAEKALGSRKKKKKRKKEKKKKVNFFLKDALSLLFSALLLLLLRSAKFLDIIIAVAFDDYNHIPS